MKSKLFLLLLLFLPLKGFTQSPVDKLFEKYSGKDGFTTVYITQYMFDMFRGMNTNDKEFDDLVKNLKSIRILTTEKKGEQSGVNFYKEIMKDLPVQQYKELMVVKEKDQEVKLLAKELKGKISELLLITGGKENVLICIEGNIDMKNLSQLSKNFNIQGFQSLGEMDKNKKK